MGYLRPHDGEPNGKDHGKSNGHWISGFQRDDGVRRLGFRFYGVGSKVTILGVHRIIWFIYFNV